MRVFVIHSGKDRQLALSDLKRMSKKHDLDLDLVLLRKSYGAKWREHAESEIEKSELVIHYKTGSGEDSENVVWELERAGSLGKNTVSIVSGQVNEDEIGVIK